MPFRMFNYMPESFNSNISYQLFVDKINFVNSQHENSDSKGDYVHKNWFKRLF